MVNKLYKYPKKSLLVVTAIATISISTLTACSEGTPPPKPQYTTVENVKVTKIKEKHYIR